MAQPIELGAQRQLLVDDYLFDQIKDLKLTMHSPRNEGPVLYFDRPWEGDFSAYCTIIKDGDLFRLYYRGLRQAGSDGSENEVTCYAQSDDGIHWVKPDLGLFEIDGTLDNNVILAEAAPVTHNFSPFLDANPHCLPRERYKALGGTKKSGLIAFTSDDGIHWQKMQEEPVFSEGLFDSQNVSFWSVSEGNYVCYFRTWTEVGFEGFRSVGRTTSPDFIHWSSPVQMKFGDTPLEHLYTQQTSPYYRAPQIYVSIGARFMPNRKVISDDQAHELGVNPKYYNDCSDAFLMTTRGGDLYHRTFMESFLRPGIGLQNWVSRSNYPALNVVQTGDHEMSLYVNENYAQSTSHLKRYSLRVDGFTSLRASYQPGELVTKPFTFSGSQLEINYATSAAGFIKIEIQDVEGNPLPGYTLDEAEEIIGNEIRRIVHWQDREDLIDLGSMPVRMHILMKDADLYSFKFN